MPAQHQADVWNIAGAAARAVLLLFVVARYRGRVLSGVAAFWLAEEAMVIGCSAYFIAQPWVVQPGTAQCSSLLSFDLGKLGAVALVLLAALCAKSNESACQ